MRFPFVTRSHHEELVAELREQLAQKDSERTKYIDLLGQLGFGRKILASETPLLDEEDDSPAGEVIRAARRPSEIVKSMNMKKLQEHEEKNGQRRRAEVMDMIMAAADIGNPEVTQ